MSFLQNIERRVTGSSISQSQSKEEILKEMHNYLNLSQSVSMILLLYNEKPGVLIMSASEDAREFIEVFCKKFGCHYIEQSGVNNPGVFIAKNKDRFKILKNNPGEFYGASEDAVGEFLGYEKKAREYYSEKNAEGVLVRKQFEEKLNEMEKEGDLDPKYELYLELVDYIPYPSEKNIMKAIKRGRERHKALESSEIGKVYLSRLEKQVKSKNRETILSGLKPLVLKFKSKIPGTSGF